jgi:glycosyltransferase involved in cell wall biosynthesis
MKDKKISIIIPVYKAEGFIVKNLIEMKEAIAKVFPNHEIIAVIDGSPDGSYKQASKVSGIKVVGYKKNMGKGHALQYGFKFVTGDYVTFIDCDMDIHPQQLKNFIPYMTTADMVIGSKRHPFSKINYPFIRKVLSRGFQLYTWLILGMNLRDTQTGLKLIKKEVLDIIMPMILVKRYAFDAELCFLAHKHGFRIVEAPISIEYQFNGSNVKGGTIFTMALSLLAIRYRYSILHYYQKEYQKARFNK